MPKPEINIIELFSGIGGFTKGFEEAGFKINKHYFSEIEKHPIANYKYNYPNAEYIGSVTNVRGEQFRGTRINAITFGSPCQDFSLAGKRAGMDGQRSSLISEAIRLVTEIKPDIFIWENVKGTFSSNNGEDFWAILAAFANIGGYRLEWQLLNTSWVLPQNRERIYLIGHIADRSKPGIFPITENDGRFNEGPEQARNIRTLTAGGHSGGLHSSMTLVRHRSDQNYKEGTISPTLRNGDKQDCRIVETKISSFTRDNKGKVVNRNYKDICNTITSATGGGGSTDCFVVKPVLTPDRLEKRQNGRRFIEDGEDAFTLTSQDKHGVQINNSIRRLTEIECERLQGFPEQQISICLEKINNHAQSAEEKCHRLQKYVLNVEKTYINLNVLSAIKNTNLKQVQKNKHALKNVRIHFGHNEVKIHNQEKLIFSAKIAESKNWFHQYIKIEDFVLLLVRISLIQEKTILIGKEGLHLKEHHLIHLKNLKKLEKKYGKEIMQHAKGAEIDLTILNLLLKCTTLSHLNLLKEDVISKTLFSFVIHAITGFIPIEMIKENISELSLVIDSGWTKYGNYDGAIKEVPKTHRYKMCGNAVTVAIVKMIAERIEFIINK